MRCYRTLGALLLLITLHTLKAHAMESPKARRFGMQKLWKELDNPSPADNPAVLALALSHIDFVTAVLCKLEERGYPAPTEAIPNSEYTDMLRAYCTATESRERVFIQQELNKLPNSNDFRIACATYFGLIGKK